MAFNTDSECVDAGEPFHPRESAYECGYLCKFLGTFLKPLHWPKEVLGEVNAAVAQHTPHSLWRRCSLCPPSVVCKPLAAACGQQPPLQEESMAFSLSGKATEELSQI